MVDGKNVERGNAGRSPAASQESDQSFFVHLSELQIYRQVSQMLYSAIQTWHVSQNTSRSPECIRRVGTREALSLVCRHTNLSEERDRQFIFSTPKGCYTALEYVVGFALHSMSAGVGCRELY